MATLTFLLGLFFANFNNTSVPAHGGLKFETKTSISKDHADYIVGDDTIGRKP